MRVLVTGGAGFIGSHIADALVERGDDVVVLDDLSNGKREDVPKSARLVVGDVRSAEDIDRAFAGFEGGTADAICHLAGQASTFRSFDSPSWDMEVNGVGTARMIEAARQHGTKVFIYASSMTTYGTPPALPVREDMAGLPISYYGVTKWAAERACMVTATEGDPEFRATAFRMFNVYGPRQSLTNPYQGVLGIFLGNVLRDEPIRIFGDGEQSRDLVYVGDVARAWLLAIDRAPKAVALNLGTSTRTTINELWKLAVVACGKDPETWPHVHEDSRLGDQRHMQADITEARRILGWLPEIDLIEGLTRTASWAARSVER